MWKVRVISISDFWKHFYSMSLIVEVLTLCLPILNTFNVEKLARDYDTVEGRKLIKLSVKVDYYAMLEC